MVGGEIKGMNYVFPWIPSAGTEMPGVEEAGFAGIEGGFLVFYTKYPEFSH